VFAGVGVGICFAGLVGLAAGVTASGSRATWVGLGVIAALFALALWRQLASDGGNATSVGSGRTPPTRQAWTAALCYGAFGYGYIIPATFVPALAREVIKDPAVFGWVWPVLGAAAALSTVLAVRVLPALPPRRLWAHAQWVLALGVVALVFAINLATLLFAALCVGGTFHGHHHGGNTGSAPPWRGAISAGGGPLHRGVCPRADWRTFDGQSV
jgi:hypothetical protein